ncbi:Flp pilus assembly protein CpaB [Paracoccus sp. IB05]|uniref:Flp pilus assembly protein CpaB n=1 Tax=Paracoccus sp. IB05 TaxID=2779367 RepID=UPI0018E8C857|nr:Flp pilus assembly protein CpaB [Paracoccus sp. IB05]MBJ2151853.1 Flp pilus assembly protein CpaB [Paracoccus sp. IB05]
MRAIFGLVLIVGVALAGFAVYMAQGYIQNNEIRMNAALERERQTGKLVQVFALKKPVKYGDGILKDNVQLVWVQEKLMPPAAYTDGDVLFPPDASKPRFAMRSMETNEILLSTRLTEPGQVAGLAGKLEPGMSAFQVRVSSASGVAGFVMPEDLIDIYWTGASGSGEITQLIESAMRVIAVDSATDQSEARSGTARTITVAVSREQVARLAQAQASGRLTMSVVSGPAASDAAKVEINRDQLLGIEAQQVVETAQPCYRTTRKGTEVVREEIACATN